MKKQLKDIKTGTLEECAYFHERALEIGSQIIDLYNQPITHTCRKAKNGKLS